MDSIAAPVLIDELLAHHAWLRRIARALVEDLQTADDLMQEVWLAALERPPKNRRSLRGWLATVLRRKAMDRSRAAGRRAHYETGRGAPGPMAPADELIAKIEMHRRVTDAVLSLEEPYRSALLLRYVGDRPVDEVARLQDAPVATVRTRLKRGLALLRKRLDAGHGGRRDEWVCLLVPIAWPDKAIWVSSGATAAAAGGGIVGTKVGLLAGSILVTLVATWAVLGPMHSETESGETGVETALDYPERPEGAERPLRTGDTGPTLRGQPERAGSATARAGPRSGSLPVHAPPPRPEQPAPVDGDATAKTATLRIVLGDGELASGRVRVQRLSGSDPGGAVQHVIARDGTVSIPTNHNVVVDISVDGRQGRRLILGKRTPDAPVDVVFGTGEVFGVVRDEQGLPNERIGVQLSSHLVKGEEGYAPSAEGHVFSAHAVTDAEGAYRFTDLPTGSFVVAAIRRKDDPAADRNIRTVRVNVEAGERVRVDLGGVYAEPLLSGVLRYGDGVAVKKMVNMFLLRRQNSVGCCKSLMGNVFCE